MEKPASFADLLRNAPKNTWIALNKEESEIVANGDTIERATERAMEKGEDDPILFWVPEDWKVRVF
jgi:hypothetical protein